VSPKSPDFDIIIRNGSLIDGTGRPSYVSDVAIVGATIAQIGALRHQSAAREIDASGLVVAPGFIDVHTHDDAAIAARPAMTPKLTQGVTTIIGGNCGISGAPYTASSPPRDLLRLVFKSSEFVASDFSGYLAKVEQARPAVNAAFLTGHTALRMETMGDNLDRPATVAEIATMRNLLARCLEQGSLGLSTGLFYPPARAASTHEVIEVARPLNAYQGLYVTHLRDEGEHVMDSLREALYVGREVGAAVVISHHKCMGHHNFGRSVATLALLQHASLHQAVALDVYPYTAGSSVLNADLVALASKTMITWCDSHPEFAGQDLSDVASALQCTENLAVAKLQPAGALYFMMDEADVSRIMTWPDAMIGSDGLPEDKHPHPRLWGTFPRVLGRYVREQKVMSIENAVYRMTGLSARHFGIWNRGLIQVGKYADLTIFDAGTILDTATFEQPISASVGIHYVVVNGRVALDEGIPTDIRAGRVLKRSDMVGTDYSSSA